MANKAISKLLHSLKLISRKISMTEKCWTFHTVYFLRHSVEKQEILSHSPKNQLLSNSFSKTVSFTKFLPKMCERENSWNFHTVSLRHIFDKNFVKTTFLLNKEVVDFTKKKIVFPLCDELSSTGNVL